MRRHDDQPWFASRSRRRPSGALSPRHERERRMERAPYRHTGSGGASFDERGGQRDKVQPSAAILAISSFGSIGLTM